MYTREWPGDPGCINHLYYDSGQNKRCFCASLRWKVDKIYQMNVCDSKKE